MLLNVKYDGFSSGSETDRAKMWLAVSGSADIRFMPVIAKGRHT